MIHIAIIDQNPIYRESLKTLLEQVDGFNVVWTSPEGTWEAMATDPPVQMMIVDGNIGEVKYRELVERTSSNGLHPKTLLLAMYREELDYDYGNTEVMLKSAGKMEFVRRIKSMFEVDVE